VTAADPQALVAERSRPNAALLFLGGIVAMTLGMVMVIGGILSGPLFLPGTWLILISLLLFAAGGIMDAVRPAGDDPSVPATTY
jgi:hypothetical protein